MRPSNVQNRSTRVWTRPTPFSPIAAPAGALRRLRHTMVSEQADLGAHSRVNKAFHARAERQRASGASRREYRRRMRAWRVCAHRSVGKPASGLFWFGLFCGFHGRRSLPNKPAVVLGSGQGGPTDPSTTQPRVRPTLGPPDCAPAAVIGWRFASPEAAADTSELSRVRSSEKTGGGRIRPARHRASRSIVVRRSWKFLEVSGATPTRE